MDDSKTRNAAADATENPANARKQPRSACGQPGRIASREPSPGDEKRGLECRHCGCRHFRVIYTRPTWGGRIMRRRECRHCGKRMTTWEKPTG